MLMHDYERNGKRSYSTARSILSRVALCAEGATVPGMGPSTESTRDDSNTRNAASGFCAQPQSPAVGRAGCVAVTQELRLSGRPLCHI